jgi:uncharacterized membrane protein
MNYCSCLIFFLYRVDLRRYTAWAEAARSSGRMGGSSFRAPSRGGGGMGGQSRGAPNVQAMRGGGMGMGYGGGRTS